MVLTEQKHTFRSGDHPRNLQPMAGRRGFQSPVLEDLQANRLPRNYYSALQLWSSSFRRAASGIANLRLGKPYNHISLDHLWNQLGCLRDMGAAVRNEEQPLH